MLYGTDPNAYRSIKVPAWVYENWKQAELTLDRRGLAALPAHVAAPLRCPACTSTAVDEFEARYRFVRCSSCGYRQQKFSAATNFVGGAILGLGLALLFSALTGESSPPRRRRSLRARRVRR